MKIIKENLERGVRLDTLESGTVFCFKTKFYIKGQDENFSNSSCLNLDSYEQEYISLGAIVTPYYNAELRLGVPLMSHD